MNLPNKLSLMRIAFVPVAAVVFLCGELSASFQNGIYVGSVFLQYSDLLVLLLFAAASITDFLPHCDNRDKPPECKRFKSK